MAAEAELVLSIVPSIWKLLKKEWNLSERVKGRLRNLQDELEGMNDFLEAVSSLPPHLELPPEMQRRANQVKVLSSGIEKCLNSFMVRKETKGEFLANHLTDSDIDGMLKEVKDLRVTHGTYPTKSDLESICNQILDPRILAMYTGESKPVGIDGAIAKLTEMLSKSDHVSIVGMTGLGKSTLAQAVYNEMKMQEGFECKAFVPIGQGDGLVQVLKDICNGLGIEITGQEERQYQLALQLRNFLMKNRYLLVIDDLWDVQTWTMIKKTCMGIAGSKIITTSRNSNILKGIPDDNIYNITPLSVEDAKKLLRVKVFAAEARDHDAAFNKLWDTVLPICSSGVPNDIIGIGSLYANKQVSEWDEVYASIDFDGHKEDGAFQNVMRSSYNDLPYEAQQCFLYLSLFPQARWIEKNMLIWMWIGEGLVADGLFSTGEDYLNKLIGRNMIHSSVSPRDIGQGGYRVHSSMLPLLRDLSSRKNFSTVLGRKPSPKKGMGQAGMTVETRSIGRLAIHETINQNASLEVGEVLSFYGSTCTGKGIPPLRKFKKLRVVDLEACDLSVGGPELKHLHKSKGLKYVRLVGTRTHVAKLPSEMSGLIFLQTLDVTETDIKELPSFVQKLKKMRCLRAGKDTRMMGRIGELTSLEELWLHSVDKSPDFAIGLRKLSEMRVLVIHFDEIDDGMQEALVESLHELKKLQVLQVWSDAGGEVRLGCWEGSVPSSELRQLLLFGIILPRPMPWIAELCVPKLSKLLLQVEVLEASHMVTLGQMMSLRSLYLHSENNSLSYTAGEDEFKVLEYLNTNIELICGKGGLPKIQELEVGGIKVRNGTDVGLGNMLTLETATYHLDCMGCGIVRVEEAERKIRDASKGRRLALFIKRWNNFAYNVDKYYTPKIGWATWAFMEKGANCDIVNNIISSFLGRTMQDIGVPHTLAVSTRSPSQEQSRKRFELDAVQNALNSYRAGKEADPHPNFDKMLMTNPEFIALVESGSWPPNYYRLAEIMLPLIASCMAEETDGSGNDQGADADGNLAESSGAGASRNETPPDEVETNPTISCNSTPEGDRLIWMLSTIVLLKDPVGFQRILKKCEAATSCDVSPEMISAHFLEDHSELARLIKNRLMEQEIWNYFTEDDMDGLSSRRPPKLDDVCFMFYVLNSPAGARYMSEAVAEYGGVDPVAIERKLMKCLLNPKIIAAIKCKVQNDDRSETARLLHELFTQEMDNYFSDQHASSTSASSEKADVQVNADSMLSHGELADASDTLSGLPIDPASAAQSDMMDAVASSTASVAQSRQDGENSSTISNLNVLLATLEKDSTDGASSRQPSSEKVDANSILCHGGPSNASDTLSGLSSYQALTAQSGMLDPVASSTASVAQRRQDDDHSTIFNLNELNLNELLATLEKESTDGASSGQPSSSQLPDSVGDEEGGSA